MVVDNFHESLEEDGIVFIAYSGILSQDIINGMMAALEKEAENSNIQITVAKKIYISFIELAQNVMKYSKNTTEAKQDGHSELIVVNKTDTNYFISTKNIINRDDEKHIISVLNEIGTYDKQGIKDKYNKLRKSGENTHSKGGGIGFYQLARKSDGIRYRINRLDDNESSLNITITINI